MKYIIQNIKDMNTNKKRTNTKRTNRKKAHTKRHQNRKIYGGDEEEEYKSRLVELVTKQNDKIGELYRFLQENKDKPYFSTSRITENGIDFSTLDYIVYKWPVTHDKLDEFYNIMSVFNKEQRINSLLFFCISGNLFCVNLLLEYKLVDANSANNKGITPLGITCIRILYYRKINQVEDSLKKDPIEVIDPTIRSVLNDPNRGNQETLLTNIFVKLIEYGADINKPFTFNGKTITIMDIQKQLPLQYQSNYINLFIFGILNFGTYSQIGLFKDNMLKIAQRNNSCKVLNKLCPWFTVNTQDPKIKEYICFIFLILTLLNNTTANNQFTLLIKGRRAIKSCLRMYELSNNIQTIDIDVLVVPATNSIVSSEWYAKNILHFIFWLLNLIPSPYEVINKQVPESNIFKMSVKTPSGLIVSLCDVSYGYDSIPEPIKKTLFTTDSYRIRQQIPIENSVYRDTVLNYGNGLIGLLTHQNITQLLYERFYYLYTYSTKEALKDSKSRGFFIKLCKQLKEIALTVSAKDNVNYITLKLNEYNSKNLGNSPSAYSNDELVSAIINA